MHREWNKFNKYKKKNHSKTTPTAVADFSFVCLSVCLSVFLYNISKTNAARITKLDTGIFHNVLENW